jgi:hypothetical protein
MNLTPRRVVFGVVFAHQHVSPFFLFQNSHHNRS